MNIKDFVRVGQKVLNLIFWMIVGFLAGDTGMGFYYSAMIIYMLVFTLTIGAMKETIARMVAVRRSKGFHDNAHRIFYFGLFLSLAMGVIIGALFRFGGATITKSLYGYNIPASVLGVFGIYFLITSINSCLTGYYQGMGNVLNCLVGEIVQCAILIIGSPFIVRNMYIYGGKVSALLKNPLYANLNGAIGAVITQCIAVSVSTLIILFGVIKSYNDGYEDSGAVRGVDNKRSFISSYIKISISVIEEKVIPILAFVTMTVLFVKAGFKAGADTRDIFLNLGVFAGKYLIVIAMPMAFFIDFVDKEKKKLRADFNKEEHKNLRTRAGYLIKNAIYIIVPIGVSAIVLAKPIVMIFFGGKMSLGVTLVRQGGIVIILGGLTYTCKSILRSVSLEMYSLVTSLAGYVAMLVFLLPASKSAFNINMLVIALVVYYLVQMICSGLLVYRMLGIFVIDIGVKAAKVIAGSVGLMIVELILDKLIVMNILFLLIAVIAGYILFFVIVSILKGINRKDINSLKGTLIYYPSFYFGNMFGGR